jgi:hypothetical protein
MNERDEARKVLDEILDTLTFYAAKDLPWPPSSRRRHD